MAQSSVATRNVGKAGKFDFELLLRILNPAIFVMLAGGLIFGFDVAALIVVGVVGYTIWGGLNLVLRRKKRNAMLASVKNGDQIKAPFDYGLVASLLNVAVLFALCVGVIKGWDIALVVAVGVVGYGCWFFLNYLDRKKMAQFNELVERSKKSKSGKKAKRK